MYLHVVVGARFISKPGLDAVAPGVRWQLAVAAVILTSSAASASWEGLGGNARHDGASGLGGGLLDVYTSGDLVAGGGSLLLDQSPGLVVTKHGIVGIVSSTADGSCEAVILPSSTADTGTRRPLASCNRGTLVGYDAANDALLACGRGPVDGPILSAFDLGTGRPRWSIVPATALDAPRGVADEWSCGGGAVSLTTVAIGFTGWKSQEGDLKPRAVAHRLAVIRLPDGSVYWSRTLVDSPFLTPIGIQGADPTRASAFAPLSTTAFHEGYVFAGEFACPAVRVFDVGPCEWGFAWYSSGGEPQEVAGAHQRQNALDAYPPPIAGSAWAAAQDGRSAVVLGHDLLLHHGGHFERALDVAYAFDESTTELRTQLAAPAWMGDLVFAPSFRTIHAINVQTYSEVWEWDAEALGYVEAVAADEAGLWVLSTSGYGAPVNLNLVRLASDDGRIVQVIPLPRPLSEPDAPSRRARLVPVNESSVIVLDRAGSVTWLGPGRGADRLSLATPETILSSTGEFVMRVKSLASPPPSRLLVHWGDGVVEEGLLDADQRHIYAAPGPHRVVVTGVYADGTTASTMMEVGRLPALDGGPLAAPDSSPLPTWLLLLVVVGAAGTGSGAALALRRRRQAAARGVPGPVPKQRFLGRYEVLRELGEGSFARAWLALRVGDRRSVVIKELHASLTVHETARRRFEREAKILASAVHPRITRLLAVENVDDRRFLVLEFEEGGSLEARLATGRLDVGEAVRMAAQVLEGLAYVHGKGILHRDIKPSNILFTAAGDAKIIDFGISTEAAATQGLTQGALPLGTVGFMSPEQARGHALDARTDLYAVAATFVRAVVGPAGAQGADAIQVPHATLADWAARGMAVRPQDRFGDADEMRAALLAAAASDAPPTHPWKTSVVRPTMRASPDRRS